MCLITLLIILLMLHQITSVVTGFQQADILSQTTPPLALHMALSGAWAAASGVMLLRVWRRSPWASAQAVGILLGFAGYSALRLLLWAQADYDRGRGLWWVIVISVTGGAGVVLWWRTRRNSGMRDNDGDTKS